MTKLIDIDKLDPVDLAALLERAAQTLRKLGGVQMPLIPDDRSPEGFDRWEKMPDGKTRRWLTAAEAAPILGVSPSAVYRAIAKEGIGLRVFGRMFVDRIAIMRMK